MLPSELEGLPQSVSKHIWSLKLMKESLGLQNEKQVREWFYNHPNVLAEFEKANQEIVVQIQTFQNSAKAALQYLQASERVSAFQLRPAAVKMELDYSDVPVKKRKIKN